MAKDFSRTERLGSLIQKKLAEVIKHELADPRLSKLTSVSYVDVSPDLSHARVYITQLNDDAIAIDKALTALNHAAKFLRKKLADDIQIRKMPELRFAYDVSIAQAAHLREILSDVDESSDEE